MRLVGLPGRRPGRAGRRLGFIATVSALMLVAAACGGDDGGAQQQEGAPENNKIFVLSCPDDNAWCAKYNSTVKELGAERGYDVEVLTDPFDPELQAQHIDQAIAQNPAAILVVPVDSHAIVASYRRAQEAGIPVINGIHRIAEDGYDYLAHSVEADTCAMGAGPAQNIIDGLQQLGVTEANIMAVTGSASQFTVQDRLQCFEDTLAEHSGYKVVAVEDANWFDEQALELSQQTFARFEGQGGIQAAYGMADNMANSIIQAAQQAGLTVGVEQEGLVVSGGACGPLTIELMRDGLMHGSVTNSPITEAVPNITVTMDFLEGEDMPKVVPVEEERITQGNLDQFLDVCDY